MSENTTENQGAEAIHRHLSDNAFRCTRHNIIVHVDSINADRTVAFCSVEQHTRGVFRRTYSVIELTWRAEQALAPLIGLGILPMISVRHVDLLNTSESEAAQAGTWLMDWPQRLRDWLGYPLAREVFEPIPVAQDPFGWRKAMMTSANP